MLIKETVILLVTFQALLFALSIFADFPVWSITYIYGMFALSAKHGADFLNSTKG